MNFEEFNLNVNQTQEELTVLRCNVCGKNYENASNLKNHLKSHFDKNYYIYCHICAKTISPWKLKNHLRSHSKNEEEKNRIQTKLENYDCRYCGLRFKKINNRTSHEKRIHKSKENDGINNFMCKECSSIFRTREELREHSFSHFLGKIHFCDFPGCSRQFKKGKLLTVHKKCHFEPQVKCFDCGQMFVQKSGLLKHQKYGRCPVTKTVREVPTAEEIESNAEIAQNQFKALRGRDKIKCDESSFVFEDIESLSDIEAVQEYPEESPIFEGKENESEEWHYEYLDEDLVENLQDDTESNPFEAIEEIVSDELDKVETNLDSFEMSESTIPMTRKKRSKSSKSLAYECDFCGKQFISRTSIFSHLLVTHKETADYNYNCSFCLRKFKSVGNLTRHMKAVHSDERQWNCDKCGAMFKEKYQLELHLHNHDRPSKCQTCGKMVANLKVHLRHHATKKNNFIVECPLCGKKTGKYQLNRHIKSVHERAFQKKALTSDLKIYPCNVNNCEEYFSRRQELRQHQYITHSQSKIYECLICGNVFKKQKLLSVHRFTHQPLNVKCNFCHKIYARKAALYKHMKKHHPESYQNPKVS